MQTFKILTLVIILLVSVSSCSIQKNGATAGNSILNLQMQDMEYIKDVQDTTVQTYFLGLLPIGGQRNKRGYVNTNVLTLNGFTRKRGLKNALYDIMKEVPDADFIVPVHQSVQIDKMFLGKKEYIALRVKAFRLKSVGLDSTATSLPSDTIK